LEDIIIYNGMDIGLYTTCGRLL